MRTRGRIWAGTLLLAVLSQFAGPLSGAASAFVGPVWLPVSQAEPEGEEAPATPDEPAVMAAEHGCVEGDAPTDPVTCVTEFAECAPEATDPTVCASEAVTGIGEEAASLVPSGDAPCQDDPDQLGCVLDEVREQTCPDDAEGPQCTAIDLVTSCLAADECGAAEVVAPVASAVCGAVGDEPETGDDEEPQPTCAERLQQCESPASEACQEALSYLGQRVEQAVCEADSVDCAPLAQIRGLLACEDAVGCGFQAVWDAATPVLCGQVAAAGEQEECGDTLDGCDMPGTAGCDAAAEYLEARLSATACEKEDAVCVVQVIVTACAAEGALPLNAAACGGAVDSLVFNVLCADEEDCPAPVRSLRSCVDWTAEGVVPESECVREAVVDAVCAVQTPCLLRHAAVEALMAVPGECPGTVTAGCQEGIQDVAVAALCASETDCLSKPFAEEIDDCALDDAACHALALLHEACRRAAAACTPEVKALESCLTGLTTSKCGDKDYQAFFRGWIADACVRAGRDNAAAKPTTSSICPGEVFVAPPRTVPTADGGTQNLPPDFENGSATFPYRTIQKALNALRDAAGAQVPSLKGPVNVTAGTYVESVTVPTSFPDGVDASIVTTGLATLSSTGTALKLFPDHRLAIKQSLKITGTPAIDGPNVTTSVTVDRPRMYVGHGASVEAAFGVTEVAVPEQVRYQLVLDGPGVSKDTVSVQTWNGTAWSDLAFDSTSATPTVELFSSAPDAAVAVPLSRSASVRVVGTATMGLTLTGRLVGVMTDVVYASDTTDYIEVAEVPDGPVAPPAKPRTQADDTPPLVRLSGEDRAATAAAVSRESFPDGADAVFVATGASYADALAGGPAAAKSGSPVVLVERDRVPEATRTELERLAPEQVRLLGGTGAISAEVEQELAAMGAEVSRLRGDSRYATAAAVSAAHFETGVPVAYIASGEGFADALSGGAAAAALGGPVLLVQSDAVPPATEQELQRLTPGRIVILGGRQAVSDTVEAQLRAHGNEVRRVSGADRYATSAAVSRDAFSGTQETVFVATGTTFPDALAGVPAAGALGAPLMLVEPDRLPAEVAAELDRLRPKRIVILGGERSVSQRLERELRSYQIP